MLFRQKSSAMLLKGRQTLASGQWSIQSRGKRRNSSGLNFSSGFQTVYTYQFLKATLVEVEEVGQVFAWKRNSGTRIETTHSSGKTICKCNGMTSGGLAHHPPLPHHLSLPFTSSSFCSLSASRPSTMFWSSDTAAGGDQSATDTSSSAHSPFALIQLRKKCFIWNLHGRLSRDEWRRQWWWYSARLSVHVLNGKNCFQLSFSTATIIWVIPLTNANAIRHRVHWDKLTNTLTEGQGRQFGWPAKLFKLITANGGSSRHYCKNKL